MAILRQLRLDWRLTDLRMTLRRETGLSLQRSQHSPTPQQDGPEITPLSTIRVCLDLPERSFWRQINRHGSEEMMVQLLFGTGLGVCPTAAVILINPVRLGESRSELSSLPVHTLLARDNTPRWLDQSIGTPRQAFGCLAMAWQPLSPQISATVESPLRSPCRRRP